MVLIKTRSRCKLTKQIQCRKASPRVIQTMNTMEWWERWEAIIEVQEKIAWILTGEDFDALVKIDKKLAHLWANRARQCVFSRYIPAIMHSRNNESNEKLMLKPQDLSTSEQWKRVMSKRIHRKQMSEQSFLINLISKARKQPNQRVNTMPSNCCSLCTFVFPPRPGYELGSILFHLPTIKCFCCLLRFVVFFPSKSSW